MSLFISDESMSTSSVTDVDSRTACLNPPQIARLARRPTWLAQALASAPNSEKTDPRGLPLPFDARETQRLSFIAGGMLETISARNSS